MDIFERLANRIDRLPDGAAKTGLGAVKLHIGTAIRHLARGEQDADETAFTDVILRCNHAFEGSVKEAYRILAAHDPAKKTPASIEKFMRDGGVLRPKVLAQFENYRTEWRNPSTHDYLLDFDADEALLAIFSVTAFAIVLCDQIRGKLAFTAAGKAGGHSTAHHAEGLTLLEHIHDAITRFARDVAGGRIDEVTIEDFGSIDGALAGYLAAEWANDKNIKIGQMVDVALSADPNDPFSTFADILVESPSERIAIETRFRKSARAADERGLEKTIAVIERMMLDGDVSGGVILLVVPDYDYLDEGGPSRIVSDNIMLVGPPQKVAA